LRNRKLKILFLGKQKGRSNLVPYSQEQNNKKNQRGRERKKNKGKGSNYIRKREVQWGRIAHEFREILTVKSYFTRKEKMGHQRSLVYGLTGGVTGWTGKRARAQSWD